MQEHQNRCTYDKDGFCQKNGWCNDRCMDDVKEESDKVNVTN